MTNGVPGDMIRKYIENITIEKTDFSLERLQGTDYENCRFLNCNFEGLDLSGLNFSECVFVGCNLSNAKLIKTALQDVTFRNCKMLGLHFDDCNAFLFAVSFENCQLNFSVFYNVKLLKTKIARSELVEVDFTGADLTGSIFDNCNLLGAVFEDSNLTNVDFRTAYNYTFDPEKNRIKKAKFSLSGIPGLLGKYDISIV